MTTLLLGSQSGLLSRLEEAAFVPREVNEGGAKTREPSQHVVGVDLSAHVEREGGRLDGAATGGPLGDGKRNIGNRSGRARCTLLISAPHRVWNVSEELRILQRSWALQLTLREDRNPAVTKSPLSRSGVPSSVSTVTEQRQLLPYRSSHTRHKPLSSLILISGDPGASD